MYTVTVNGKNRYPSLGFVVPSGRQLSFQKTKQDFSTLLQAFSPGDVKNVRYPLNELLVNFREESSGIGRFCRLEF